MRDQIVAARLQGALNDLRRFDDWPAPKEKVQAAIAVLESLLAHFPKSELLPNDQPSRSWGDTDRGQK